jgi:hypothetical protein
VPGNTPGKFPKIVKYADGYGSLNLDEKSICYTQDAVEERVAFMEQSGKKQFGVLVQDYIIGTECSAIAVEMGREVVALTPLQYVFPDKTPDNEAFLTWYNKFEAVDKGVIKYAFVEEEPYMSRLQSAAVQAFKALGVSGGGGWARVDMRLERGTGDVYVIEVNCIPVVFYPKGNTLGDDLVVGEKFPGGQAAFFDMLLATKQIQMGSWKPRYERVAAVYDRFAPTYDSVLKQSKLFEIEKMFVERFDFSGSVLDIACGTGGFGDILHKQGVAAEVSGIELSKGMTESSAIKAYYKQPIRIGPMQELIMVSITPIFIHFFLHAHLHLLTQQQQQQQQYHHYLTTHTNKPHPGSRPRRPHNLFRRPPLPRPRPLQRRISTHVHAGPEITDLRDRRHRRRVHQANHTASRKRMLQFQQC